VTPVSRKDVTIGIDIGTTAVKAVAADENGEVTARVRIPHRLNVPAPDSFEHDADEAWRRGPLAALDQLGVPDARAVAVAAMVPSMTAVDATGRPVTPGLLYGDVRGRAPGAETPVLPALGEAAEFLRWTAAEAPGAAGYWPAPAVANHALAGEPVIDVATAATAFPLFDGTGWNPSACAERGATAEQMPRVETIGTASGQVHGGGPTLGVGAIDAICEQILAGADREGEVLVMCGTTLIVWAIVTEARQVPGLWTIPHTSAGKSQIGGASNAGGLFLGWVDRLVAPADPATADPRRVPVWSPYLRGERTPFHDPDRRGVLDALDLTHDAASVRRASADRAERCARDADRDDRWRHPGPAMDAGHRRRDRPAGGGLRGRRGRGAGRGFPGPHGCRSGIVDQRCRPVGRHRAGRRSPPGVGGGGRGPVPPLPRAERPAVSGDLARYLPRRTRLVR